MTDLSAQVLPYNLLTPTTTTPAGGGGRERKLRSPRPRRASKARFLSNMLGQMFEGVSTDGPFGGGAGEGALPLLPHGRLRPADDEVWRRGDRVGGAARNAEDARIELTCPKRPNPAAADGRIEELIALTEEARLTGADRGPGPGVRGRTASGRGAKPDGRDLAVGQPLSPRGPGAARPTRPHRGGGAEGSDAACPRHRSFRRGDGPPGSLP